MTYPNANSVDLGSSEIIHNASQIFNRLAEQNIIDPAVLDDEIPHYIAAKYIFISIAEKCLHEQLPISTYFKPNLFAHKINSTISFDTFTILWLHMDMIIAYYEQCTNQYKHKQTNIKETVLSLAVLATEIYCAICLTTHKKQDSLCVQICQHEFGKTCLLEWQNVSKQCPLCRSDAKKIHGYKA